MFRNRKKNIQLSTSFVNEDVEMIRVRITSFFLTFVFYEIFKIMFILELTLTFHFLGWCFQWWSFKDKGPLGVDFCSKSVLDTYLGTYFSFFHLTLTVFQIGRQKVSKFSMSKIIWFFTPAYLSTYPYKICEKKITKY